jgi:hypothetical protein
LLIEPIRSPPASEPTEGSRVVWSE